MEDVQVLLNDITNGFPSSHVVREYLESGDSKKIEASALYLLQRDSNFGLSPEDEANLNYLVDNYSEFLEDSEYQEDIVVLYLENNET